MVWSYVSHHSPYFSLPPQCFYDPRDHPPTRHRHRHCGVRPSPRASSGTGSSSGRVKIKNSSARVDVRQHASWFANTMFRFCPFGVTPRLIGEHTAHGAWSEFIQAIIRAAGPSDTVEADALSRQGRRDRALDRKGMML